MEACTGRLFQFDPLSAAVMACIEGGAGQISDVLEMLAGDLGVGPDDSLVAAVQGAVGRFIELGWLEQHAG
jgi:hypothetical protein